MKNFLIAWGALSVGIAGLIAAVGLLVLPVIALGGWGIPVSIFLAIGFLAAGITFVDDNGDPL